MWACPVRNWIRWLNVLQSESKKHVVGLSMGVKALVAWKPELRGFGWLLHLWIHASCISLLWRDATYACVRRSRLTSVGRTMVLCVTRLYRPVLTLRTYHCHYESGIPPSTCFFDQNPGNSFSTCPPNYGVIIS